MIVTSISPTPKVSANCTSQDRLENALTEYRRRYGDRAALLTPFASRAAETMFLVLFQRHVVERDVGRRGRPRRIGDADGKLDSLRDRHLCRNDSVLRNHRYPI